MAIIKSIKPGKSLKDVTDYITQEEKTEEKLLYGVNCNPETAFYEMQSTKELYNKTEGRQYLHYTQSFKPGETTPEQAHEIGKAFAERLSQDGKFEVLMATHKDREHLHNHFIVNSVSFEDGKKYQSTWTDYKNLKEYSNELCKAQNLSTIEINKYAPKRESIGEIKIREREGRTHKDEIKEIIAEAKSRTTSKEEFKKYIENHSEIKVHEQKQNYKFKHPEIEKQVGGNQLGEEYSKVAILNELKKNKEIADKKQDLEIANLIKKELKGDGKMQFEELNIKEMMNKKQEDVKKEVEKTQENNKSISENKEQLEKKGQLEKMQLDLKKTEEYQRNIENELQKREVQIKELNSVKDSKNYENELINLKRISENKKPETSKEVIENYKRDVKAELQNMQNACKEYKEELEKLKETAQARQELYNKINTVLDAKTEIPERDVKDLGDTWKAVRYQHPQQSKEQAQTQSQTVERGM